MKKYLALVAGLIFVLGFSAVAFAIHAEIPSDTQAVVAKGTTQLTLGGEIRARGEYKEVDFNNDTPGDSYYDSRVRLSVDAQVTPNTSGFVQVEAGSGDTADNYTWGIGGDGAKGIYAKGNAKRGQFNVLQAWILHKGSGLLGVPAGVKVGHMPLALGNKLFFAHDKFGDDAIVFFVDPTKELHIGLLTAKFREGTANQNVEVRGDGVGDDDGRCEPNEICVIQAGNPSLNVSDDADAYVGLFTYKGGSFNLSGDVTYVDDRSTRDGLHFWNFGLRGDIKLDTITLRADAELQTGSMGTTPDVDFAGYAFLVGADVKLDPVTLTAEFAYGSGDDDPNDRKVKAFVTSLGADPHFTYVYEYRTNNACRISSGGLCNTMYVKLGASAKPAKDLTASLNLYWLQAVKEYYGVAGISGNATSDKNIGIEIDPKIVYQIDKNLSYWVEGGYLMAGDFWGSNADDAYAVRHGIMLTF